jgi:cytochrome c oxidase cbb3-type subunit 2
MNRSQLAIYVKLVVRILTSLLLAPLAVLGGGEGTKPGQVSFEVYAQGREVFHRNCIICHGERGDGNGEMAKDLPIKPRSFREIWFKFRSTPYDKLPTDDDLRRTIRSGLSGTAMGAFNTLGAEDQDAVIAYLKSFSRRWRKEENYAAAMAFPREPEWFRRNGDLRAHEETGRALFSAACAACHGAKGDGEGPSAPGLMDSWGHAVKPSDLRSRYLRCGDGPGDIFRILSTGLSGTPMASFAEALTEDQRWDVAAYVLSLRNLGPEVRTNDSPLKK